MQSKSIKQASIKIEARKKDDENIYKSGISNHFEYFLFNPQNL